MHGIRRPVVITLCQTQPEIPGVATTKPREHPCRYDATILLVYRCLHQLAPAYLSDLIIPYTPAMSLRSADSNLITTNLYRLEQARATSFGLRAR